LIKTNCQWPERGGTNTDLVRELIQAIDGHPEGFRGDTCISLKRGIWSPETRTYSDERLKVINFPVLKSHSLAGVTACIKHYMGVVSQSMMENHPFVSNGGLAAEMAQVSFPTLNILDAIYVNPHPIESRNVGPLTPYTSAIKTN
jgi:uncharacterized protein (DUF362 family)